MQRYTGLEDCRQVYWGMPSEDTPARKQEGRNGQRETLTHNEAATEAAAGMPGAVIALQGVPS